MHDARLMGGAEGEAHLAHRAAHRPERHAHAERGAPAPVELGGKPRPSTYSLHEKRRRLPLVHDVVCVERAQ